MKISFKGWARDHGEKPMVNASITPETMLDCSPFHIGQLRARVTDPEADLFEGVEVQFGTSVKLGGDHVGVLRISKRELVHMLNACNSREVKGRPHRLRAV